MALFKSKVSSKIIYLFYRVYYMCNKDFRILHNIFTSSLRTLSFISGVMES
jgi:hypothetical protein